MDVSFRVKLRLNLSNNRLVFSNVFIKNVYVFFKLNSKLRKDSGKIM